MLGMIMNDQISKTTKLLYTKKIEKRIFFKGISLVDGMVVNIGKTIVNDVYNLIRVKDDHKYLGRENDYDVYYDTKNHIKHYLKKGVEDFYMFYINNGYDVSLYKNFSKDRRLSMPKTAKQILIDNICIYISIACLSLICTLEPFVKTDHAQKVYNEIVYDNTFSYGYVNQITVDEIIKFVKTTPGLSDIDKKFLNNEKFFEDVIPYYKNTDMEYLIRTRLKNVEVKYDIESSAGSYRGDNVLHVHKKLKKADDISPVKQSIKAHEFVHLFQHYNCPIYIKESGAELIASEYFHQEVNSYREPVFNLMLLVETLGPEVIWKYIFAGDGTDFNYYLDTYLEESDKKALYKQLLISPSSDKSDHKQVEKIIEKLYKNIYGTEMKDDRNIYKFTGEYIHKGYYFYQYEPEEKYERYNLSDALKYNIVDLKTFYQYSEVISKGYYDLCSKLAIIDKNKNEYTYSFDWNKKHPLVKGAKKLRVEKNRMCKIINSNGKQLEMPLDEAIDRHIMDAQYMHYYYADKLNNILVSSMKYDYPIKEYVSINPNYQYDRDFGVAKRRVLSIQDRFPEQVIRHSNTKVKVLS